MSTSEEEATPVARVGLRRVGLAEFIRADEALEGCPLLRTLSGEVAERLLASALVRRYPDQAFVFHEGEPGGALYLVLQGEARLLTVRGEGSVEVGGALKGDFFGEGPGAGVRGYSAMARGALDVAELPAEALAEARRALPALDALLCQTHEARQRAGKDLTEFLDRW